jgi:hypothetical protein
MKSMSESSENTTTTTESLEKEVRKQLDLLARENSRFQQKQFKYLLNQAFDLDGDDYVIKMKNIQLKRSVINQPTIPGESPSTREVTLDVAVPLITLIPLNCLGVSDYTVDIIEENGNLSSQISIDTAQLPLPKG